MTAVAADASRASATRAVRAEWVKFGTLASNTVTVVAACALVVALAGVLVWAQAGESVTPTTLELLTGVSWAQLLLPVLAAVCMSSEWSSGTSQVTFLAVPTRWPVLLGKTVVMGVVAFLAGAVGAIGALAAGWIGGVDVGVDPALATRLVVGAGCYLGGLSMLAVGVSAIVRNLVASILTVVGLLWVLPLLVGFVPSADLQRVIPYLPSPAGGRLIAAADPSAPLTPWAGGAVLLAWVVAALVGAILVLRRRDV